MDIRNFFKKVAPPRHPQPAILTAPVLPDLRPLSMTGQTVGGIKGGSTEQGPHTGSLCCDEAATILTRNLLGCGVALKHKDNIELNSSCEERHNRHFTPSQEKVEGYREKRRKNNEAAKRSREKRRANDTVLEMRVLSLLEENARLRAEHLPYLNRFQCPLVLHFPHPQIFDPRSN
ncbi:nuclear factor interleukin-3-regulated protein-like isoform X2 [Entelurus aequoreus]|uniref:nuclear factor interleukin-3-regulated protein-like isoform X2 n=1 Tax=Entelurus aequoreus TaxID=161455 RepID=UPI002B1CFD52|nr:nuclear factor interleukin-3-regulated protein-like isoform X2 [Entelurus aequoreus]